MALKLSSRGPVSIAAAHRPRGAAHLPLQVSHHARQRRRPPLTVAGDSRITRREVLRRWKLDELPQCGTSSGRHEHYRPRLKWPMVRYYTPNKAPAGQTPGLRYAHSCLPHEAEVCRLSQPKSLPKYLMPQNLRLILNMNATAALVRLVLLAEISAKPSREVIASPEFCIPLEKGPP